MKWISSLDPRRKIERFQSLLILEQCRWILWFPVAMGIGIVGYFHLLSEPPLWVGAIPCLIFGLSWFASRQHLWRYLIFGFCFGILLGFTAAQCRTHMLSTFMLVVNWR